MQHEDEGDRQTDDASPDALLDDGRAEGGGNGALLIDDERVFQRVHQRVGKALHFAGFAQAFDDELFAERHLVDDRSADDFAVQHDGDFVLLGPHVLGEGDHFVGAVTIEGDGHGIRLLRGGNGVGDVRAAERHTAVEQDRAFVFVAVLVLALECIGAVAGNDFGAILHALGQGFSIGAGFLAARADFAEFEFGDFFQSGADAGGFLGFHAGHLDEDAVGSLAGDHRFRRAHAVEAFFDDEDRLVDLLDGDGHFCAVVRLAFLNAQGE